MLKHSYARSACTSIEFLRTLSKHNVRRPLPIHTYNNRKTNIRYYYPQRIRALSSFLAPSSFDMLPLMYVTERVKLWFREVLRQAHRCEAKSTPKPPIEMMTNRTIRRNYLRRRWRYTRTESFIPPRYTWGWKDELLL